MKTVILTITLSSVCLISHAAGSYLERPQEVRVRQTNSCSMEDFSSKENAEKYIAEHGGELFKDQDTNVYRAVKCRFGINDRVVVVSDIEG
jgi:hypothetical protein